MYRERGFKILFWLLVIVLVEEAIRYAFREGDFVGYAIAGEFAFKGKDLYSHWLNTWPPLFSILCIPIYWVNYFAPMAIRIIWQLGSLLAFYHTIRRIMWLINGQNLALRKPVKECEITPWSPNFIFPFLLIFKFLLDNLSNIQINVFMLALVVEATFLWKEKKRVLVPSFLIALTISTKVYTIFFFIWFALLRQWKIVFITLAFILLLLIPAMLYFGVEQSWAYYAHWWKEIAQGFPMIGHKNQSFFAAIWRLTVDEDAGLGIKTNLLTMSMENSKLLVYGFVVLIGIIPARALFYNKDDVARFAPSFCLFLAVIPLLSPLAWKAYYIFLTPSFYYLSGLWINRTLTRIEKWAFILASALLILSSDLFIGPYLSDLAELYSFITLGGLIILLMLMSRTLRTSTNS